MRQVLEGKLFVLFVLSIAAFAGSCGTPPPTVDDARIFVDQAEAELLELWIEAGQAAWVKANFITEDTEALEAASLEKVIAATADLAADSTRFDGLDLPPDLARKIRMIKTSSSLVAPRDAEKQAELSRTTTAMESLYGKGKYCSDARAAGSGVSSMLPRKWTTPTSPTEMTVTALPTASATPASMKP